MNTDALPILDIADDVVAGGTNGQGRIIIQSFFFDIVQCSGYDSRRKTQTKTETSRPFRDQTGVDFEPFGGIGGF